ncbi:MAG: hypothetical protein IKT79_07325 [Akkermansia sp.]|nr:hypothetical protein [Akkermansia sp.]
MVDNDDKYAEDEENLTQVRSIIKQLNDDRPSKEKHREVVVRADGTKVVRVTKKRRVMMTSADHRRINRRQMALVLLGLVVLASLATGLLFYRMAGMTGSSYVATCQNELQQCWGASEVRLEGAGVEGTTLSLTNLVAEFPEESMLQRVELYGIEAQLDMMSFFSKVLEGDEIRIDKAVIVLRPGTDMHMPVQLGADMWRFRRADCKDLTVRFGDNADAGPMELQRVQAYMYYPQTSRDFSVVILRGGSLSIRNWKTVSITEGKARIAVSGITDFSLTGNADVSDDKVEQIRTSISFAGKMENGTSLCGPYSVESDNMSLSDFTNGRFVEFLTARTVAVSHGRISDKATVELAASGDALPVFCGEWQLKDICLSSFPALASITEHIVPDKRRLYNPISLQRGYVVLGGRDGCVSISLPIGAVQERDLVSLQGKMEVNSNNELSGELEYGIPVVLPRAEYPDGHPDPIFMESGEWAWLRTRVKGMANMPSDDMEEIEARAQAARATRPARIPFSQIDINRLSEQMGAEPLQDSSSQAPEQTPQEGDSGIDGASTNPFNPFGSNSENPFASPFPF